MSRFHVRHPDHDRVRRIAAARRWIVVGVSLVAFVAAHVGIPVVAPVVRTAKKDASTPFPCQNRPCGCMSAAACMRHCCCFSARERLSWARSHDVEPPASLVAAAEAEEHDGDHARCCHVAHDGAASARKSIANAATAPASSGGWRVTLILGSMASQCQGHGPLGSPLPPAISPPPAVCFAFDWTPVGWALPAAELTVGLSLPPEVPPPRA